MKNRTDMGLSGFGGRNRAATFIDVMIILLILVLVVGFLLRYQVTRAWEISNRIECAKNMRKIGLAMMMYSNENKGSFPRTLYVQGAPVTEYTGTLAGNPFAGDGPAANDVTASAFLLMREQEIGPESFVCPSTTLTPWDFGGKKAQQVSNFPGGQHLGYSFSNPYPGKRAMENGYRHNSTLTSEFPVVADMNPGGTALGKLNPKSPFEDMMQGNSMNHGRFGQNVMFGDMHIEFTQTSFCGMQRDCIYTAGADNGGAGANSPAGAMDTILMPIATIDPGYFGDRAFRLSVGVGALIVLAILGLVILRIRKKSRSEPAPY